MLQSSSTLATVQGTLLDRVADVLAALACTGVWVRGAGRHVLLGRGGREAFARLTAMGAGLYGLAFQGGVDGRWELLLVDDLRSIVEHALVGATVEV